MDLSSINLSSDKKELLKDVIFYISLSLLISAVLCYFIFSAKISSQKRAISQIDASMSTIGTDLQKQKEAAIFSYRKKIDDFANLMANHKSALNILNFLEQQTMPRVWFNRFNLSEKDKSIILSGEAESVEVLSHQVMVLESNQYVKKIDVLSSSIGDSGRVTFNLNAVLDPKIFIPIQPANINIMGATTP